MLNKVILIGNLGAEPECRMTPGGLMVTSIRLATSRRWKDRQTNERKEETEWHRVVFFNRLAEIVRDYVHKGQQIYVEGRIRTQKWQGQDGQERYTTEIVAEEMHMLGSSGKQTDITHQSGLASTVSKPDFDDEVDPYGDIPF